MTEHEAIQRIWWLHQQQQGKNNDLCTCELFWPCNTAEVLAQVEGLQ